MSEEKLRGKLFCRGHGLENPERWKTMKKTRAFGSFLRLIRLDFRTAAGSTARHRRERRLANAPPLVRVLRGDNRLEPRPAVMTLNARRNAVTPADTVASDTPFLDRATLLPEPVAFPSRNPCPYWNRRSPLRCDRCPSAPPASTLDRIPPPVGPVAIRADVSRFLDSRWNRTRWGSQHPHRFLGNGRS